MDRTLVAVFDHYDEAVRTRQELLNSGFTAEEVDLSAQSTEGRAVEPHEERGFWDKFRDFFVGQETEYYHEARRRGGTILRVTTDEGRLDKATNIVERHNPVDIDRRAEEWRREGWQPAAREGEKVLPVVEEQLRVEKQRTRGGGVRIFNRVTEKPVEQDVHLREEHVDVERRAADRPAKAGDLREESFEMRESREEPVVHKEARVVEEVVLNKDIEERTETVKDTVRRSDVEIQQLDREFRSDFEQRYAGRGYTYEQTQAAYRYGEQLALDPYYGRMNWSEVEPEARRRFEERNPGRWDEFKDAVHRAFDRTHERRAA